MDFDDRLLSKSQDADTQPMVNLKRWNARPVISALPIILVLSGCASNGGAPKTWAVATSAATSCEAMQGKYKNVGSAPKPLQGYAPHLTNILRFSDAKSSDAAVVKISIDTSGVVAASALLELDGEQRELPGTSKLVLRCANGIAKWSGSERDLRSSNVGDPLVGVENISFELKRGSDGALYVETSESTAGLVFMFLPFAGSYSSRYRFESSQ